VNDIPYHFFFSHSRADWDVYLSRFFEDLGERVARATGIRDRKLGFRDASIKTGADWSAEISAAVQISNVLVCVYTPSFFSRERTHESCAQEFMAFLKRDSELHYEEVIEQDCPRYRLHRPRNIVPVLWFGEDELVKLNKLPPYAVSTVKYTLDFPGVQQTLSEQYKKKGMSLIATRRSGTYREILGHLARRIVELSASPLPSITPPPDIMTLRNAFWDPPEEMGLADVGSGPFAGHAEAMVDPAAASLGPKQLAAFEVRHASDDAPNWMPYGELTLRGLVEEIAQRRRLFYSYEKIDPDAEDFPTKLLSSLADATEKRVRPILFVDPKCLDRQEWRRALVSLLRHEWRGGILIPANAADKASVRLVKTAESEYAMSPNEREWIIFRTSIGGIAEFCNDVISVADEILALIVKHGAVTRNAPDTSAPSTPPRIANTRNAWRGQ
jgi:hypothetical protein